ncbi:hypothetical protein PK98_09395 [Croceibacterium mercuriale]|uniref:Uncharacterized protein n=1 Tax=Croceibacterium mercuriale TaxID=1572751 RepID=A0A0B2BYN9_9SPHN|nr:hypothetical protein [Croceibacterium mercuriale]KHL26574.1 hypothetical protein PK98_09395 [Croceibacterium mercuriale]
MVATATFGLSACGEGNEATSDAAAGAATQVGAEGGPQVAGAAALNIADGPDVCFRAIAQHLGPDAKVAEINSFFSSGEAIDSSDDEPQGQLTVCSVQYQDPADARKLLGTSMNVQTGEFEAPSRIDITVTGGDASEFKLADYIIPLAQVNAAGLAPFMEAQKGPMGKIYSSFAWSGVRLMSPGVFSDVHVLRLDIDGRLATNDIKESGYAEFAVDGTTLKSNNLEP